MKKTLTKTILFLLVVCMILPMYIACAEKGDSQSSEENSVQTQESDGYDFPEGVDFEGRT